LIFPYPSNLSDGYVALQMEMDKPPSRVR